MIHNPMNVRAVTGDVNQHIANYYSRIRPFTEPNTVRGWLTSQTFEQQFKFGEKILDWVLAGKTLP